MRFTFSGKVAVGLLIAIYSLCSCKECPGVVWISFDGFHPSYMNPVDTPNMLKLREEGTYSEDHMKSQFITKTFPNFFSQATGLYPESHGIVENSMKKPDDIRYEKDFNKGTTDPIWWNENGTNVPIWIANQKHGKERKSGVIFWVGSNVVYDGMLPSYFELVYDDGVNGTERLQRLKNLINEGGYQLLMAYITEVDTEGHAYGFHSEKVYEAVRMSDGLIGELVEYLKEVSCYTKTNLLVSSDHGMANITDPKIILYQDIPTTIEYSVARVGPYLGVIPKNLDEAEDLRNEFNAVGESKFHAFLRHELPDEIHYKNNARIVPLIVIPQVGYYFQDSKSKARAGDHGWHNEESNEMNAIFMARGPNFKPNTTIVDMQAVDIYVLVCKLLKIEKSCAPSNGTLGTFEKVLHRQPSVISFAVVILISAIILILLVTFVTLIGVASKNKVKTGYFVIKSPFLTTRN